MCFVLLLLLCCDFIIYLINYGFFIFGIYYACLFARVSCTFKHFCVLYAYESLNYNSNYDC